MSEVRLTEGFVCAICRRQADNRWRGSRDRHVAPVCVSCETISHYAWHGAIRQRGSFLAGAFMDRRKARQIDALADALSAEAHRIQWENRHAAA